MNEKPTPETDALRKSIDIGADSEAQMTSLARKLERERNEWAAMCGRYKHERDESIRQRNETNESSVFSCNFYYEEKLKAEQERDEAREEINRYREKNDLLPISWDV